MIINNLLLESPKSKKQLAYIFILILPFGSSFNGKLNIGALDRGVVDATIWVSPLCTSRAAKVPEVCTPIFKAASCYPYCMAARLRGSSAKDGALVLYSAADWKERVHLMLKGCIRQRRSSGCTFTFF
jgi:hypothetical protein